MPNKTVPPISSTPPLSDHEKAWETELAALDARLRASGLKQRVKPPSEGAAPLVVTFHRAKPDPTKGKN